MKSKKQTYILLFFVLLIWGGVMYEFFSFSKTPVLEQKSANITIKPLQFKYKDTFSIVLNQRDPFLGKIIDPSQTPKSAKVVTRVPKQIQEIVWPEVKYKGIVTDAKDKVKVYMLIIDGKTYFMHKAEKKQDILLKDGDRQTVYLEYKGDLKVVFIG